MVVGDKQGGETASRLAAQWSETCAKIDHLRKLVGRLKFKHVVRNVFDNIATMITIDEVANNVSVYQEVRSSLLSAPWKEQYSSQVSYYLKLAGANMRLFRAFGDDFLHINGKALLADPQGVLRNVCGFLNVPFSDQWAATSAAKLCHEPFPARERFVWPQSVVNLIQSTLTMTPYIDLLQLPSKITPVQ